MGYHGRINGVLRTYMLAVISKEVLSAGDRDRNGDEIWGEGGAEAEGRGGRGAGDGQIREVIAEPARRTRTGENRIRAREPHPALR